MSEKNHLPLKKFYILLFITSILVLVASIEALILVKDGDLFLQWAHDNFPDTTPDSILFTQYVSSNLSIYFLKVLIPASIATVAFITATKARFTPIVVYIWIVLSFGGLAFTTADMNFQSIFFYINGLFYTGLILYIYFIVGLSRDNIGGED
ncbi:hypothetical protein [Gudongella sp. DL1XJH-153]|uniref:hypothetical protein n=1 Tax=Gudongella sp. DL1XJH-153 TaxID=3409804 RepID=UPI003BB7BEAD